MLTIPKDKKLLGLRQYKSPLYESIFVLRLRLSYSGLFNRSDVALAIVASTATFRLCGRFVPVFDAQQRLAIRLLRMIGA